MGTDDGLRESSAVFGEALKPRGPGEAPFHDPVPREQHGPALRLEFRGRALNTMAGASGSPGAAAPRKARVHT